MSCSIPLKALLHVALLLPGRLHSFLGRKMTWLWRPAISCGSQKLTDEVGNTSVFSILSVDCQAAALADYVM